jgi:outer membrane protein OmpA-like peptidoglycan-associated protein
MEDCVDITNILKSTSLRATCIGAFASTLIACATSATPQLADARRAYDDAEASTAPKRAPGALAEARVALDRAEQEHKDNPGSEREAQLAERAKHKARMAEARADGHVTRAERVAADRPRSNVSDEHPRNNVSDERARDNTRSERVAERRTPRDEKHANAALQSLAQVANVKEEPRGIVITLSGSLLFPSGEEEVSPVANRSLDQVADALAKQPSETTFQVEGYTDNSGSETQNRDLSEQRARAVAERLERSGIDPDRIRVIGRGEDGPIASNDTSEGRASNRRVEIVVDRPN